MTLSRCFCIVAAVKFNMCILGCGQTAQRPDVDIFKKVWFHALYIFHRYCCSLTKQPCVSFVLCAGLCHFILFKCAEKSDGNSVDMMPHNSCVADWKEDVPFLACREFSDWILAQHCVFFEIFVYPKMDAPPESHRFVLWSQQGEEPPHHSSLGLLTHPNITTLLQLKVSTGRL